MKIHLIKKQTIEDFVVRNARSKSSFGLWLTAVKFADWNQPADIKRTFNSADLLGNNSFAGLEHMLNTMSFVIRISNIPLTFFKKTNMETLKYKIIKTEEQYKEYCSILENLLSSNSNNQDEIELLTFLIEKWDQDHNSFEDSDPIELLRSLMEEHNLKSKDLVEILGVSKGLVSDILNYKKGLSKEIIRSLSSYFNLSQEAFNRPYKLKVPVNSHLRNASVMNSHKEMTASR